MKYFFTVQYPERHFDLKRPRSVVLIVQWQLELTSGSVVSSRTRNMGLMRLFHSDNLASLTVMLGNTNWIWVRLTVAEALQLILGLKFRNVRNISRDFSTRIRCMCNRSILCNTTVFWWRRTTAKYRGGKIAGVSIANSPRIEGSLIFKLIHQVCRFSIRFRLIFT